MRERSAPTAGTDGAQGDTRTVVAPKKKSTCAPVARKRVPPARLHKTPTTRGELFYLADALGAVFASLLDGASSAENALARRRISGAAQRLLDDVTMAVADASGLGSLDPSFHAACGHSAGEWAEILDRAIAANLDDSKGARAERVLDHLRTRFEDITVDAPPGWDTPEARSAFGVYFNDWPTEKLRRMARAIGFAANSGDERLRVLVGFRDTPGGAWSCSDTCWRDKETAQAVWALGHRFLLRKKGQKGRISVERLYVELLVLAGATKNAAAELESLKKLLQRHRQKPSKK